jgi:DNA-binding beta-propeller fold protein YncE
LQVGKQGTHNGSNDLLNFWRPAKIYPDPAANEIYIADGYGNRRVIVLDADTGKYKRHWGAYGNKPDDSPVPAYSPTDPPSKHFNTVHCADVAKDGLVYVCDRVNDRVQVFRKGWHVCEGSLL